MSSTDALQNTDAKIGAAIRTRRKDRGWSQADLAKSIGVTYQQVQKYETGGNRVSATTLARIAKSLGCEFSALLDLETDPQRASIADEIQQVVGTLTDDRQLLLLQIAKTFSEGLRRLSPPPTKAKA